MFLVRRIERDLTPIVNERAPCAAIEPNLDTIIRSRKAYVVPRQIYDHSHLGPQLETKLSTSMRK